MSGFAIDRQKEMRAEREKEEEGRKEGTVKDLWRETGRGKWRKRKYLLVVEEHLASESM